jgi:protein LSM14
MGTEGRRNGVNEIEPSDKPWEYIVFRGSDVKDLRIETAHVPDDPAILGVSHDAFTSPSMIL